MRLRVALAAIVVAVAGGCGGGPDRVIVAAGTTLVDSGLLDAVVADYEQARPGAELSVVGDSTARLLELGRRGAADLLITHAPAAEAPFVAAGLAARVDEVLASDFVLVGPPDRVDVLAGAALAEAFRMIAERGWDFVTRDDGSGTHERELALWAANGIDPAGERWYVATGQGMGLTLQVADQRRAFTLAERGTYLAASGVLTLVPVALAAEPGELANPYRALVVAGGHERAAGEFVDWLLSADGRAAVLAANERLFGEIVYFPAG